MQLAGLQSSNVVSKSCWHTWGTHTDGATGPSDPVTQSRPPQTMLTTGQTLSTLAPGTHSKQLYNQGGW